MEVQTFYQMDALERFADYVHFSFLNGTMYFSNTYGSQENLNDQSRSLKVTDFIYVIMDEKSC